MIHQFIRSEPGKLSADAPAWYPYNTPSVLDWDSKAEWMEWQFSGWQAWGGEQPDDFFWTPKSYVGKLAFSTEPLKELYEITPLTDKSKRSGAGDRAVVLNSFYDVQSKESSETRFEIELELVSRLDAPNRVQIMIRCPMANKSIVETCIDKDFKFTGEWPTKYAEYTLKKPTRYSESSYKIITKDEEKEV
tara:strand:+ start:1233 stop:1805 length:573 start_codon:yes stop_codon:yes gene_type:complete